MPASVRGRASAAASIPSGVRILLVSGGREHPQRGGPHLDRHRKGTEPLTVSVRHDVRRGETHSFDLHLLVPRMPGDAAGEQPRVRTYELGLADRMDDGDVKEAVVIPCALADPKTAAERWPVAHGDEHRLEFAYVAIEFEGEPQRFEADEFGDGGEVVTHLTAGPGHAVCALVDGRVESRCDHGGDVSTVGVCEVDPVGTPSDDRVDVLPDAFALESEVSCRVVPGARRYDTQGDVGAGERICCQVHHAVATDDDQRIGLTGRLLGQICCLRAVTPLAYADREPCSFEHGNRLGGDACAFPLAGRRVDQDIHAWDGIVGHGQAA